MKRTNKTTLHLSCLDVWAAIALLGFATAFTGLAQDTDTNAAKFARKPADDSERPTAKDVLPKVEDLGPEWYWPWNVPRQYTFFPNEADQTDPAEAERTWRARFNRNPSGMLLMQCMELEGITDDEFKQSMAALSGLMGMMADTNSAVGMELSGGGTINKALDQMQTISRTQMVAELRAQYNAFKDWAANDYHRAKPNGKKSDIPGYVPTDDDSLTLELTLYAEDYIGSRKIAFDLNEQALQKAVAERRQTKDMVQKALDGQLEEYAREYESAMQSLENATTSLEDMKKRNAEADAIASQEKHVEQCKKSVEEVEKAMLRVTTRKANVKGAMLEGVDGGYFIIETTTDSESSSAMIYGKLRRGAAVLEFSRSSDGPFATTAQQDTLRILNIVSKRLGEWAKGEKEDIKPNPAKTLNYDYATPGEKIPSKLKEKTENPKKET